MVAMEITAHCEGSRGSGWRATVPGRDCDAHAKRLDKLREDIAHQIHEETGTSLCDVVVHLEGVFPEMLQRFEHAHDKLDEAEALRTEASAEIRAVVAALRSEQLTFRDIAALLDITPQRVAQLANR